MESPYANEDEQGRNCRVPLLPLLAISYECGKGGGGRDDVRLGLNRGWVPRFAGIDLAFAITRLLGITFLLLPFAAIYFLADRFVGPKKGRFMDRFKGEGPGRGGKIT